jgi:peroxiredoxin
MTRLKNSIFPVRVISTWFSILLVLGWGMGTAGAAGAPGDMKGLTAIPDRPPAPSFSVPDVQGNMHSLSDYQGKVVIVNFWAVWCSPCREEMPSMQRAWEEVRDQDVVLLAINWKDSDSFIDQFLESFPHTLDFPLLKDSDGSVAGQYGVKGLPATFVVDPQGRLVYRAIGEREWDDPDLLAQILALKE